MRELWEARELLFVLAKRDVRVRYKQSLLGVGWAVVQPFLTMVVFAVLFTALLGKDRLPTAQGIPYAVSTFAALVPWQLFSQSLARGSLSIQNNQHLVTKVYFPRLIAPVAPILAGLVDFAMAFVVLVCLMLWYGIFPTAAVLLIPVFVLLVIITALSVSLWLAAINAVYRDIGYVVPFVAQLWMFVTPVVYDAESVLANQPDWVRVVYGMNPMVSVIEGFRWALLGTNTLPLFTTLTSLCVVLVLLVGGLVFFKRMEKVIVDLV